MAEGNYTFLVKDANDNSGTFSYVLTAKVETAPELIPTVIEDLSAPGGRLKINGAEFYIAPDGRAVSLPVGATPAFFKFSGSWASPPTGTLQGFKIGTSYYFADITNQGHFRGYRSQSVCFYNPDVILSATPTGQVASIYLKPYIQGNKCGYKELVFNHQFSPTLNNQTTTLSEPTTVVSSNVSWNRSDCSEIEDENERNKIKIQLSNYLLDDVGVEITYKNGQKYYITSQGISTGSPSNYKPTNFKITEKVDGDIDIDATFKSGCSGCSTAAKESFDLALQNAKTRNGGKIGLKDDMVKDTTILNNLTGISGGIHYEDIDLGSWLSAIAKGYNSIIDNAKIPEEMWKTGRTFPVRDFTGVVSGSADQVIEDGKDIASMVGIGLTIIANPSKAKDDLVAFTQNITWSKAGEMLKTVVKEGTNYNYLTSSDAQDVRYGRGRSAVTLVKVATGTGLVAMLKSPNELAALMAKIKRLLEILKIKLNDINLENVLEADLADDAFYAALDADNDLVKGWKVLQRNNRPLLKLDPNALQALNRLKANQKLIDLGISEDILGKMKSYKIGDDATDFAKICDDVDDMLKNALPDANKITNFDKFLGSAGFGNASDFTRRHADLGLQKIKENGNFIKNADEVKFEEFANYDGVANAVADLDFTKDGKRFVAEFKAGNQVITSNFSTQSINFMQRVNDLKHYKVFRRADVTLTKQAVINDWVSKGVLDNTKVQDLIKKFGAGYDFEANSIKNYLESTNGWFDSIFNSNF